MPHYTNKSIAPRIIIKFRNRQEATQRLVIALEKYTAQSVLVLGVPHGEVVTAYYIAKHLKAELSFVITCELNYLFDPQTGFWSCG
ncbi:hypothetical protein JMN32_20710 [Fulvivirga sp. 29W222]|uniref:Phosphoribosyltransferase domain-containing protein n=1 Tax=Fulvivirga marina TaxID=2494733 RepID=A0A937G210_9BACT|nr:hypothetical protein [Fulvivirga marina]MBL6448746.1 hypothetical protein [Fulvivirga marina]